MIWKSWTKWSIYSFTWTQYLMNMNQTCVYLTECRYLFRTFYDVKAWMDTFLFIDTHMASYSTFLWCRYGACKDYQFLTYRNSSRYTGRKAQIEAAKNVEKRDSITWSAYVFVWVLRLFYFFFFIFSRISSATVGISVNMSFSHNFTP